MHSPNFSWDGGWGQIQGRTFTKWINTKLSSREVQPMKDLIPEICDGVKLIQLLEIMSDTSLGRYNASPKFRVHKAENAKKAIDFIRSRGIRMTNIGPEDIVDGNLKIILGLIWTLILRFTIDGITEEGLQAREGLLLWCQRKTSTELYQSAGVEIRDFGKSFASGLAFCALIHRHRPDLINWESLDKEDARGNTALAFEIAAKHLNISPLLEVEDVCDMVPDERSVMTYVAEFFHAFSSLDKQETTARRITQFVELLKAIEGSKTAYEADATKLVGRMQAQTTSFQQIHFSGTYPDARQHFDEFARYQIAKRELSKARQILAANLGNVQTRLRLAGIREYRPGEGASLETIDAVWAELGKTEIATSQAINANLLSVKARLKEDYRSAAQALNARIARLQEDIALPKGSLETQQASMPKFRESASKLREYLSKVAEMEAACREAKIDEIDLEATTVKDFQFELELLDDIIQRKETFIDNQIKSASKTNVTKEQLSDWEQVWQRFEVEEDDSLDYHQLNSALAALGITFTEEEMDRIYQNACQQYGAVTHDAFVGLLVEITEDSVSMDQLLEAFHTLANGDQSISEADMQNAHLSQDVMAFLKGNMKLVESAEQASPAYDYQGFLGNTFAN